MGGHATPTVATSASRGDGERRRPRPLCCRFGGVWVDPKTGSILTPICQTTTYVQLSVDEYLSKGYSYSRTGNPTVRTLERKITLLEGGHDTTSYSNGMAAIQARMLALLNTRPSGEAV